MLGLKSFCIIKLYFKFRLMENNADKIAVKHFRLGYVDKAGKVEVLPFLDLSRKDELWGIECERLIISLKNSGFGRWDEVMRKGKPLSSSWRISLPFEDSLAYYFVNRFRFKQEIENLRSHGIEVDDWLEGWYWSCEELGYNGNRIHTFNMYDGSYSTHDRYNTNGFVRYALICMH